MKSLSLITGSRAEWGLLQPLAKQLADKVDLRIIALGSHLSNVHGITLKNITEIELKATIRTIENIIASDTQSAICKSAALALFGFDADFSQKKPDGIIILGDRYEILMAAISAHIMGIPIYHIHGGEESGNYDNAFRHSISHMASYHFVAGEEFKQRLIKFGIMKKRIFNVGALGCDGLYPQPWPRANAILIIYHSETLKRDEDFNELLIALKERQERNIFFLPNVDDGNSKIRDLITGDYLGEWISNLERKDYLKLLGECQAIVGNSSSGIIEAPALGTPTINIGKRQSGRKQAASIINCDCNADFIRQAFDKLYSDDFQKMIQSGDYYKPYGGENVAQKIAEVILKI